MNRLRGSVDSTDVLLLTVVTVWAANNVLTKAALNHGLEPLAFVASRFLIVSIVLGTWLALRGQLRFFERADLGHFLLAGALGYAIANLLFAVGLSRTTAFASSIFGSTSPVFMLIFAALLGLEKVRVLQWLGVLCAFGGVAIFVADKVSSGVPASGDLLNLFSAASFAAFSLISRPLTSKYGPQLMIFWSVTIGALLVLPVSLPVMIDQDWAEIGPVGWTSILYASIVSMMAGYIIWSWAIHRRGAGRTAPYMFLIPPIAGILAWVFLDERINAWQVVGGACILAGVFLALHSARVRPKPVDETDERPIMLAGQVKPIESGAE